MKRIIAPFAMIALSIAQAQDGFDYEAEGINDSASNETRELCIAMVGWALPTAGVVNGYFDETPNVLLHAHTIRA